MAPASFERIDRRHLGALIDEGVVSRGQHQTFVNPFDVRRPG
jgi:hypothetical protein